MTAERFIRQMLLLSGLALSVTACAGSASSQAPHVPPAPQAPAMPAGPPTAADAQIADAKFAAFVRDFRTVAIAQGIKPETYDRAMAGIVRNPKVEQANLQQPEFVKPVWDYLDTAVSDKRVATGAALLAADTAMLGKIERRFGVSREYLVAIWGLESNYGQAMGHFNLFEALATLAYDGPRADYGRKELLAAFKMVERDDLDPKQMTSSWAGAFGHTQFVPSAYLADAVDGDGDGTIDLWHSPADALASTALLLANAGWTDDKWGEEVTLPTGFDYDDAEIDTVKSVADWSRLGVRDALGGALPDSDRKAAIIVPGGARGPAFLVFDNFKVILKYNNAQSYALAVSYLASRIKGGPVIRAAWPRDERPLSRDERIAFQTNLKRLGFDPGDIDGVLGRQVRMALRAYQKSHGLVTDGFATVELLMRMEQEVAAKGG